MKQNFKKGFTLIELSVIIGIIGILAVVSLPAFRIFKPTLQLSGAVRELITDLRYAEQLAVTEQIEHGIRFSSSTNEYSIIKYGAVEEQLRLKQLPETVSFQIISGFAQDEVKFNPYGAAREAGSITLINSKGATTTLDVGPSGFVKIIKPSQ